MRNSLHIFLICLLLTAVDTGWAGDATGTVVLRYAAGSDHNDLRIIPQPGQNFVTENIQGIVSTTLASDPEGVSRDWLLDVLDDRWSKTVGDGIMIVDFIDVPSIRCETAGYDSILHSYHRLQDPAFRTALESDPNLPVRFVAQINQGKGVVRQVFLLRKAWFGNRLAGSSDIQLQTWGNGSLRIARIVVKLKRVCPCPTNEPVSLDQFLGALYPTFLKRLPTDIERRVIAQEMSSGRLQTAELLFNILRSWEFLERTVFPFENAEGSRRLFRIACGRNPTNEELNVSGLFDITFDPRDRILSIVGTYYAEIVENLLRKLRKNKKMNP